MKHNSQVKLFNASESEIIEMLCDPDLLSSAITLSFEYEMLNMSRLSSQLCNPDVAKQIKASFDISSVIYEVSVHVIISIAEANGKWILCHNVSHVPRLSEYVLICSLRKDYPDILSTSFG